MFDCLITADELESLMIRLGESAFTPDADAVEVSRGLVLLDASFSLMDRDAGRLSYEFGHIPGAVRVDLDRDLCCWDASRALCGGRHPLPPRADIAAAFWRLGVRPDSQVVCYDRNQSIMAARAWWMLKFLGHDSVAVLDGGYESWLAGRKPVELGVSTGSYSALCGDESLALVRSPLVDLVDLETVKSRGSRILVDARGAARYRGEYEPLDARAGHIPGAENLPFTDVFDVHGAFLPKERMAELVAPLLALSSSGGEQECGEIADQPDKSDKPIVSCGSGVSAAVLVLAAKRAGLPAPALYGGSYSEWSAHPELEVECSNEKPRRFNETAGR